MAKITIEDGCGDEKTFTIDDEKTVDRITSCLAKKQSESLGDVTSSTIKIVKESTGEIFGFYLEREDDGDINVKSFNVTDEEEESDAGTEVYFSSSDGDMNEVGNNF
jgi:hypothetical protein